MDDDKATPGQDTPVEPKVEAQVKSYAGRIKAAHKRHATRFKRFANNRQLFSGEVNGRLVRTNLILSTISGLIPQVYAKSPDISVSPGDAVSESQFEAVKKFGKTVEVVLGKKLVREGQLKKRAKSMLRSAMITAVGWLKLTYQKDFREDPHIRARLNDAQENIERIKALRAKIANDDAQCEHLDAQKAELEEQVAALGRQVERTVSEGFVIDKLLSEQLLVLDETVSDWDDYINASAIAQMIPMSVDEFETRFKRKPSGDAKTWYASNAAAVKHDESGNAPAQQHGEDSGTKFVVIYEIWCKQSNTVKTWCDGEKGWAREPFQPNGLGRRWYPFFGLCLNPVDGQLYGVSDVDMLAGLQEEYLQTRDDFAKVRKHALPKVIVRSGSSLTEVDIDNIKKAQPGETVVVAGDAANPITNDVQTLPGPQIDPALFDVTPIMRDIEMVSGAQDAARGVVNSAKTATEAEIMQQALVGRTSERQDAIEDVVEEMAQYATEIALHEMTAPLVMRLAGQDAVWPMASKPDEVLELLNVEIRAGSSGKPDKARERQQWIELLPVVKEAMGQIHELRMSGSTDMADAVVELLRETLRRFDERIDIDAFLPRTKEGEANPAQAAMELQQAQEQLMQAQQMLEEMQGQLQALEQEKAANFTNREFETQAQDRQLAATRDIELTKQANAQYDQRIAEMQAQITDLVARVDESRSALEAKQAEVFELQQQVVAAQAEAVEKIASFKPPEPPAPPPPPEMPDFNLTIPITIEGSKGTIKKTAKGKINKDGTISMTSTEGDGDE